MLTTILASTVVISLVGMAIIPGQSNFTNDNKITETDIVAILTPALTAIGAVAGENFSYTVGARGAFEGQQSASEATQQASELRQEAAADIADTEALANVIERISGRVRAGGPAAGTLADKRLVSVDDLETLADSARSASTRRASRRPPPPI